jgi:glycosyltransferase involved in cell wall biosynthesis
MSKIEFIIPTWERPEDLKLILQSLMVQTNSNWTAHVVIDGLTNDYREVKDMYQNETRVRFSHVDGPNNDWGHTARNYGLDHAQEEWIVMTGDDNYYVPLFVEEFLAYPNITNCKFVYCNMVHNGFLPGYRAINSILQKGQIDIGNFMVRRDLIGDIRLNTKSYEGDWEFAEAYMKANIKRFEPNHSIIKIDKFLYVHN